MDEQWVERLVEENRSALLAYFRRHVSGREDAEDLLEDIRQAVGEEGTHA